MYSRSYEYRDRGASQTYGGALAHDDADAPFVFWIWLLMQLAARAVLALSGTAHVAAAPAAAAVESRHGD